MMDIRMTSKAISTAHPEIAVVGIGAIEQHGHHLPIGTDWMIANELSRRVAEKLNALLIPTIPISMSECHGTLPGTVWLKPATLSAVLQDIIDSLHAQGIYQVLLLNCHGGNFVLEPTIQALHHEYPDMLVIMASEFWPLSDREGSIFEHTENDLHAGEVETSLQLYLHPQLVSSEPIDALPPVGREFLDYVTMDLINPDGVWGSASLGNADKGRRTFIAQVESIASFAQQAFARRS
jgi:creatinine amidohydrolase